MRKWPQEPIHNKINFWHAFSRFLVDFGIPWGPQGGTFFSKNRDKSVKDSGRERFLRWLFLFWAPFWKQLCFWSPQGLILVPFLDIFYWNFDTFWSWLLCFSFLRPLYLTAKLVLTTSTRSSLRYESVAASGLHYIIKDIQNILNIQNIPNIPNIQVISQVQSSRPAGMREAIRRPQVGVLDASSIFQVLLSIFGFNFCLPFFSYFFQFWQ